MSHRRNSGLPRKRRPQAGMTLLETMIALAILLVIAIGVMVLAVVAVSTTETQGHLAARTAEYAQDKMEQLMALKFCDNVTDTAVFPAAADGTANATGLAGCNNPGNTPPQPPPTPLTGGGSDPSNPVAGYVDYLDASGNLVASTANWEYVRVWQISVPANMPATKQITVVSRARRAVGQEGLVLPQTTVVALKTFPF
jgi:prepilin-type N-terminal cleavage/methylation domain-containing protein